MIVYGDPSYHATLDVLIARLRERLAALMACGETGPTLDLARGVLIEAGAIEQAAEDAFANCPEDRHRGLSALTRATDSAAMLLAGCRTIVQRGEPHGTARAVLMTIDDELK